MIINRKRHFFESAAVFATIATCLVLPIASSLLSLFSILLLLCWLCSGKIKELVFFTKNNPVALVAIVLLGLFLLGMLYSSASLNDSLSALKKYRELIFIPILISLFRDKPSERKTCESSFITGCIILMLISYCMYFSIIPAAKYGNSVIYHITHSYFMAILAYFAIHKTIDSFQYRYLWIVVFTLSVINLFYIAPGRTGMLVFLFLMILFLAQRLSMLYQMIGLLLLTILLSATFMTSDNFATRSSMALKEIQNYEYGGSRTSLGMRFDWWINCIDLIKEKPLFGHGTGSFTSEHDRLIANTKMQHTDNPHNEYLFIGVQLGLVGLAVYIALFFVQLWCSKKLDKQERMFVQGVVVSMIVGCLMNSFLFDSHQGHFWAILSSIYLSSYPYKTLPLKATT